MTTCCDVAIIGAGLIGASIAYQLASLRRVVLIEQESQPGYHSSGRSAAVLLPAYGGPSACALTAASSGFLHQPPDGFSHFPLTAPRGALVVANADQLAQLEQWRASFLAQSSTAVPLSVAAAVQLVPILESASIAAALLLPGVRDIDAASLLQGYLKSFRAHGGTLQLDTAVRGIERRGGWWHVTTSSGELRARTIVNAAGAWADDVAEMAGLPRQGLVPTRRTMVVVDAPDAMDVRAWPLVVDAAETFYFKPGAGRLVVCPADQSPVEAQDIQPEEWDVAVAIDRLESATSLRVRRVEHRWAGLRTFTPDREPLIGADPDQPDFIWAAGFGGFGVQTSYAAGCCCAAVVLGESVPAVFAKAGIHLEKLAPRRFTTANGTIAWSA